MYVSIYLFKFGKRGFRWILPQVHKRWLNLPAAVTGISIIVFSDELDFSRSGISHEAKKSKMYVCGVITYVPRFQFLHILMVSQCYSCGYFLAITWTDREKGYAPPPKVEIQLDYVWPISIRNYATGGEFQMCVAIFTKLGDSIDSCLSTCFTEKNENLVGTSWIGFVFYVFFFDGAWHKDSENFGPPDPWKTLVHFFRWLKSKDGWSCKIQVCICACWTWLAATSRGDQRNWWYCGTVKRGILYWTCDNPSGHPNI